MNRPALELYMIYRYWVMVKFAPNSEFKEDDIKTLKKFKKEISDKLADIDTYKMEQVALCEDPKKTVPRWPICARCSAISAAPDGCGYMCGLTRRAVIEAELNTTLTECLDSQKINPPGGSSGITGGVDL